MNCYRCKMPLHHSSGMNECRGCGERFFSDSEMLDWVLDNGAKLVPHFGHLRVHVKGRILVSRSGASTREALSAAMIEFSNFKFMKEKAVSG